MIRYLSGLWLFPAVLALGLGSATAVHAANPGDPIGPAYMAAQYYDLQSSRIAPLPGGASMIVWKDTRLRARAFEADGTPRTAEILVSDSSNAGSAGIASNSQGDFVVAWIENHTQFKLRRFNAAGIPLDEAQLVGEYQPRPGWARALSAPAVGLSDSGDIAIVWYEGSSFFPGGGSPDCEQQSLTPTLNCWQRAESVTKLRRYVGGGLLPQPVQTIDNAGSLWIKILPLGPMISVGAIEVSPSLSMAPNGRFVVAWWRNARPDALLPLGGIYARKFSMNGQGELARWVSAEGQEGGAPSVAMTASGHYVVVYPRTARNADTTVRDTALFAREYAASALLGGAERMLVRDATLWSPFAAVDANGNYVAAWDARYPDSRNRVVVQRFARGGSPLGPAVDLDVLNGTAGSTSLRGVARNPTGEFTVLWEEWQGGIRTLKARAFAGP